MGAHVGVGMNALAHAIGILYLSLIWKKMMTNFISFQVIADVFNAPVYIQDVSNSAALGCAYRAKHGV